MITVKFSKIGATRYMSHLDLQTVIIRSIKRAGFVPNYSQGHNPHPILKMSPAIPVGINSEAEYFTIDIDFDDLSIFNEKLSKNLPSDLVCSKFWKTTTNPKLTKYASQTEYKLEDIDEDEINMIRGAINSDISQEMPVKHIDSAFNGVIKVTLPIGNKTIRLDRFLEEYNRLFDKNHVITDAKKVSLILETSRIINADAYLSEIALTTLSV